MYHISAVNYISRTLFVLLVPPAKFSPPGKTRLHGWIPGGLGGKCPHG